MQQYLNLLREIKAKGTLKPAAREGMPGTISLFGYQFRHNLADGFPLLTTKKMFWKGIVYELLWFLRGSTNIKFLVENGINIWNEDAFNFYKKNYKELTGGEANMMDFEEFIQAIKAGAQTGFIEYQYGDCGYQYGKVWRDWHIVDFEVDPRKNGDSYHRHIDQISNLINGLLKQPESRRHIVTAIDPAHENNLALYWCHALFQFNCRPLNTDERMAYARVNVSQDYQFYDNEEEILKSLNDYNIPKYYLDCQLYQRSADVVLGVPFNIASYALLTELLANICNMIPGEFIHTFGDVHIYKNHMDAVNEQLQRRPASLPKLTVFPKHPDHGTWPDHFEKFLTKRISIENLLDSLSYYDFRLEGYDPQPAIKAELSTGLKK